MENDIKELKLLVDNLQIATCVNTITIKTLVRMTLGVYTETLPEESARNAQRNFLETLEKEVPKALTLLDDLLDDKFLSFREREQFDFYLTKMKAHYGLDE